MNDTGNKVKQMWWSKTLKAKLRNLDFRSHCQPFFFLKRSICVKVSMFSFHSFISLLKFCFHLHTSCNRVLLNWSLTKVINMLQKSNYSYLSYYSVKFSAIDSTLLPSGNVSWRILSGIIFSFSKLLLLFKGPSNLLLSENHLYLLPSYTRKGLMLSQPF